MGENTGMQTVCHEEQNTHTLNDVSDSVLRLHPVGLYLCSFFVHSQTPMTGITMRGGIIHQTRKSPFHIGHTYGEEV